MIMNALNGVWSDTERLQIIIQHKLQETDKDFTKRFDFKSIKLPLKTRDILKTEKKNSIGINVFGYQNKVKYPIYVSKKCCGDKHVELLLTGEEEKGTMFLSRVSIHSCMIMHYIVEENIFVSIVCKLLEQHSRKIEMS